MIALPQLQGHDRLTNSRMACMRTCPRKHLYRYELGIRKDIKSQPLRMGGVVHHGLELISSGVALDEAILQATASYGTVPAWASSDEQITDWFVERQKVMRLILAYEKQWRDDRYETIETEISFDLPIKNPETGASTPTFRIAGKIDRIVRLACGRLALLETKTTGESIDPGADYWRRLRLDQQISLYMIAARELGYDVQTVMYDVIRKPSISPKKIAKATNKAITETGLYFGEAAEAGNERETPEMYGARLAVDIETRPHFYFARREVARMTADLDEFAGELWDQQKVIRECQKNGRWFRNTNACMHPYPCEYREICFNGVTPDVNDPPQGFTVVNNIHPELESQVA